MAMAVAIDTSRLALDIIPWMQERLDRMGGEGRHYQIHRVSLYATILSRDSEIHRYLYPQNPIFKINTAGASDQLLAKQEAMEWQADPDDDLGDAAVLHHLQQQAATIPLLASAISQSDRANSATTLIGAALSPSINARTQGRPLSSFLRYSSRLSDLAFPVPISGTDGVISRYPRMAALFPHGGQDPMHLCQFLFFPDKLIVWAGPKRDNHLVFSQAQVDVIDLCSRRHPTYQPRKRRRTSFNQFLQLSHSPVVEVSARRNPLPHAKRFNGVRHRTDRNIWVAEMKPTKHKTKQDFGNFKSEDEAARAVDAAFHHYDRPDLLNFPHTSLQFLSTRPTAPAGLDEKAKVKFVREEAILLLEAIAASSPLHSTHTNSLQMLSPRRFPSGPFRSLSEISSPFSCSGPYEVDDVVAQPQPWMVHDSLCDISTTGVPINLETLNSVQHPEQGWNWAEDSCALAVPPSVVDPSVSESPSMFPESIIRWSPAPTYPRSPSPSHFQAEISYNLWEHQSI